MPALWVAAAGAVAGAVAGSQEQGGGTTQTSSSSAPWEPQQDYLKYGFQNAQDLYKNAAQNPVYQGNRVAALNPYQTNIANLTGNYAQNTFGNANTASNLGQNVSTTGSQFAGNASNLFNQYSGDPTQQILANANQYANSPYAQGLVDSASRDITRNLYENQLPTLAKAAAGSGNTNSTRAGVESAIAQRGAADRLADVSSSIRGSLFNTGLQQSQSQYNQNLQNSLAANGQLYNAYNAGNTGMLNGQQMAENSYNLGTSAGGLFQNQNQNEINAQMQKFSEENNVPMDLLQKYMNLVNGNYGGTSSGTSTAPSYGGGVGGALTGALGGGLAAYGTYGKLNSAGGTKTGG